MNKTPMETMTRKATKIGRTGGRSFGGISFRAGIEPVRLCVRIRLPK
jgi:hypothetical protein